MGDDNTPMVGGTYEMRDGKRVLVTPPTQDHPEGNRPREADGTPIAGADERTFNREAPAAEAATPRGRRKGAE